MVSSQQFYNVLHHYHGRQLDYIHTMHHSLVFCSFVFPVPSFEGHQPLERINYSPGTKRRANAKETLFQLFKQSETNHANEGVRHERMSNPKPCERAGEILTADLCRPTESRLNDSLRRIWKGSKNPTHFGPHIWCAGFPLYRKITYVLKFANDVVGNFRFESENEHKMVRRNKLGVVNKEQRVQDLQLRTLHNFSPSVAVWNCFMHPCNRFKNRNQPQ